MTLFPIALLIVTMVAAFGVRIWFWRLRYIRCLNDKNGDAYRAWDSQALTLQQGTTLNSVRWVDGGQLGSKIVILHHLVGFAEDVEDQIRTALGVTLGYTAVVVIGFLVFEELRRSSTAGQQPQTLLAGILAVLQSVPVMYVNFLPLLSGLLWQVASIVTLQRAIRKHREVFRGLGKKCF